MKFDYSYITEKCLNKNEKLIKSHEPIITVITPFYNGGKYLEDTAKAVLNQTFPYFEWLIIDDGSTDEESLKKLKKVSDMDDRISVYHKENTGLANTRDYGAKKSSKSAKYLFFLDDDDIINNTYLECAYWTLQTNSDASWTFTDVIHFGEYEALATTRYNPINEIRQNVLVATALIRKCDFEKVGGYELKEKAINEDWNLWLKMIAAGMYPVRMSFFGFWYRRKVSNESELYRASKNKERTKKIIAETAKNIKNPREGIQYPKQDYNWDLIDNNFEDIIIPKYEDNKKIKILMVIPWMVIGGADKFNIDLIKGLDKDKFEITIISTEPNYHIWRERYEWDTKAIYDLTSFLDRKYWLNFINYIIQKNNIDIIFNSNSTFGYSILPILKRNYPSIPIIDYIHMEEWYNRNGGFSRDSSLVSSVVDKTFVCNENTRKILINHFNREDDEIKTIYIGVDEEKFNPSNYDKNELRKKYNIKDKDIIISFIARIDYQKRPMLFIKVLEELLDRNDNKVVIVAGDGPLLSKMKEEAKKLKIDNQIRFLGAMKETDEIYAISDVTVNCSIKEGLALTTYESLSMGVPVVSANVGGQAEIISDDVGVIVECLQHESDVMNMNYTKAEIDSYVNGINKILSNLDYYKSNSRKKILNGFTIKQMICNMSDEFESLVKKNNNNKVLNGKNLVNNEDICLELITKYFMTFSNEYDWLVSEFNKKLDCEVNKSVNNFVEETKREEKSIKEDNSKNNESFKRRLKRAVIKLHIHNESIIIYNAINILISLIRNIFVSLFKFIKCILNLLKLICIRIVNIFRRLLKKKPIEFNEEDFNI